MNLFTPHTFTLMPVFAVATLFGMALMPLRAEDMESHEASMSFRPEEHDKFADGVRQPLACLP